MKADRKLNGTDVAGDKHFFPWPGTRQKQHRPTLSCWCTPERRDSDPHQIVHRDGEWKR